MKLTAPGAKQNPTPTQSARRWWPLMALGAVAFVFFWQYFLLDQTLYAGDTAFVFFPFRQYSTQRLMGGEIPLWNPYLFGGTPTFAESTYQIFYLPNLLFWVTGVARGIGWTLPLHLLWLSVGVYLFGRRLGLGRLESVVAAIAFSYGGSIQGRLGIPVYTQGASWIPWILIGYDIARQRGGIAMILPALALAMQLLTGAPPYTYYTLVMLFAFHLYQLKNPDATHGPPGPRRTAWLTLGVTLVFGVLLTTAQLLPEWELARLSERGTRSLYDYATWGSMEPRYLVTMVLPKFFGLFSTQATENFLPSTDLGYVGVLTLGLALASFFSVRRRAVRFWAAVAFLGVFLALGRYNPIYPFLYRFVPGVGMFRMPGCWLLVTNFALAILAAIGLETLRTEGAKRVLAARAVFGALVVMVVVSSMVLLSPLGAGARDIAQTPFGPWGQVAFIAFCALPPAFLAFSGSSAPAQRRRIVALSIPVLIALDLFLVSQDMEMQQTLSVAGVQDPSATAKALQVGTNGSSPERFWPGTAQVPMEKWQGKDPSDTSSVLEHRAQATALTRSLMPSCLPAEFQTMGLTGAWGALMPLRRNAVPIYKPETPPEVKNRWLQLLNVRTHLSLRPLDDPKLTLQSSEPIYIYRDETALPRGFWVPQARGVTGDDAISILSSPTFDPRREVLIEDASLPKSPPAVNNGAVFDSHQVRILKERPEHITLEVEAPSAGHVVLMDSAYPGWHARVDGRETPLQIANWMGRSVPVDAGTHRIEMWFEPMSVRFGFFISLVTVTGLVAWCSSALLGQRKRPSSS